MQIAVVLHPRPGEEVGRRSVDDRIILDAQAFGRAHAVVDHLDFDLGGAIEHHRAPAAHAVHPGLQHPERKSGCNDRIDAIAAGGEHLGAHLGGLSRLRCNDAAFRRDGGFPELLVVGKLVG